MKQNSYTEKSVKELLATISSMNVEMNRLWKERCKVYKLIDYWVQESIRLSDENTDLKLIIKKLEGSKNEK